MKRFYEKPTAMTVEFSFDEHIAIASGEIIDPEQENETYGAAPRLEWDSSKNV